MNTILTWLDLARSDLLAAGISMGLSLTTIAVAWYLLVRIRSRASKNSWLKEIVTAIQLPLIVGGLLLILLNFAEHVLITKPALKQWLGSQNLVITISFAWFLWRTVLAIERSIKTKDISLALPLPSFLRKLDSHSHHLFFLGMRISVWIVIGLMIMQALNMSITGVLAFGGAGGLIIGFAAKEVLADMFSSLTLLWSKEFEVGDWIKVRSADIEGTVESITWRKTCVRSLDKRLIHAPNSLLATSVIENISNRTHRRINEIIGLRYDDITKIKRIIDEIKVMLTNHPGIDERSTFLIWFDEYGDFSVNIKLICMTKSTDGGTSFAHKQDVLLKIAAIVSANGANFAFPTQTLHVKKSEPPIQDKAPVSRS